MPPGAISPGPKQRSEQAKERESRIGEPSGGAVRRDQRHQHGDQPSSASVQGDRRETNHALRGN